jgi:hypothetical protein
VVLGLKADDILVQKSLGYSNPFTALVALVIYSIAGLGITVGFCGLGVVSIIITVMASFNIAIGLTLLPFLIERQFSFIGSKGIGMILDGGISVGALSIFAGASYGMLTAPLPPDPGFSDAIVLAIKAVSCFVVCLVVAWKTSGVATGVSGIKAAFGG